MSSKPTEASLGKTAAPLGLTLRHSEQGLTTEAEEWGFKGYYVTDNHRDSATFFRTSWEATLVEVEEYLDGEDLIERGFMKPPLPDWARMDLNRWLKSGERGDPVPLIGYTPPLPRPREVAP